MHWKLGTLAVALLVTALTLGSLASAAKRPQAKRSQALAAVAIKGAAGYLGFKPAQLRKDVRAGTSLAALAAARGKSVEGLQQAMLAAVKARLDKATAAGRLDAERAQKLLTRMQARIAKLVSRTGALPRAKRGAVRSGSLQKAAREYLGLTGAQLREQRQAGRSLAQIAVAQGKSVDDLRQAMLAAAKTRLDARVAAGKLTAERAQAALTRLQARIARLVGSA